MCKSLRPPLNLYSDDLPNAGILDEEFHRWKVRWLEVAPKERPQTLSEALKLCSPDNLPNVYTLMKLFATLPLVLALVNVQHLPSGD